MDALVVTSFQSVKKALPTLEILGDTTICPGENTFLDVGTFDTYLWNTGATTSSINVNTPGTFAVTVTEAGGCPGSDAITVVELSQPSVSIGGNFGFCPGASTTLDAGIFDTYLWNTGETTQNILVNTPGNYAVTVTNADGL